MKYNIHMRNARTLLILGIWVAILPYLGFPLLIKNILFSVSGLVLVYLSYILYADHRSKEKVTKVFETFSESNHFQDKDLGI